MNKLLSATVLSVLLAMPAYGAEPGYYVGGNLGSATASGNLVVGLYGSHSDTSFSVLGGYQVSPNLAAEIQYTNMGELTNGVTRSSTSGFSMSAVGMLPLNRQLSVYGKLGFASTAIRWSGSFSATDSNFGLTLGMGAQLDLNRQLAVRAGFDTYSVGDQSVGSDGNYVVVSAGILARF